MKKRFMSLFILVCLLFSISVPTVYAANERDSATFYGELSALLKSQDDSIYFGSLSLNLNDINDAIDAGAGAGSGNDALLAAINEIAAAAGIKVAKENGTVVFTGRSGEKVVYDNGTIIINGLTVVGGGATAEENTAYYLTAVTEAFDLVMDWRDEANEVLISAPYQTARILAYAETLDSGSLNAVKALHSEGLWVLQFNTPAEARAACLELENSGITVSPDYYVPVEEPPESEAGAASVEGTMSVMATYNSWGVADCKFPEFLNQYSSRMSGNGIVAVIDSGVDAAHPFLKGRVLPGYDFVDNDSDPSDGHGHGTHVAGTIIDCSGNAPVSILPVRVMDNDGSGYTSTIVSGIRYAVEHGADVINLSLGGIGRSSLMKNAITEATSKGTLVVVAAGNESIDTLLVEPAYITVEGNVVVSAGDSSHTKASFSNYGQSVDIMAPGVGISSCIPGGQYASWSGTSMAAPHVAAAAILLDLATGKSLSPADLEELVRSAGTEGAWKDKYTGYGFLDMSKAAVPAQTPGSGNGLPFPDRDSIQYPEAIETLVGLGVLNGYDDGLFHPQDTLTRGQACKILVTLYDLQPGSKNIAFNDVSGNWAERYIMCCASLGIVVGYGDGNFGPNDPLTGDAWAKMLLVAMGHDANETGMIGGNWAEAVAYWADLFSLFNGMRDDYKMSNRINREEACQMAYNSIQ